MKLIVYGKQYFFPVLIALGLVGLSFQTHPAWGQTNSRELEQARQELESFVGERKFPYDLAEKLRWDTAARREFQESWPHKYHVLKKGRLYGLVVREGIPARNTAGDAMYIDGRVVAAFLLSDIPKGYVPVIGCRKVADWQDLERRCKASKGRDCSLNKARTEMVVFVRMPSRCAQESELFDSAYRYDDSFQNKELKRISTNGMRCIVEDHRPKDCPVLID